jgi:hypothetical protein
MGKNEKKRILDPLSNGLKTRDLYILDINSQYHPLIYNDADF